MNIENVKTLINTILNENGLTLYDLKFDHRGKDKYLRVFIDKEDGRLSLDDIVDISGQISLALDEDESIKDAYILDVSSAGAEKVIKLEHLTRFVGHYIKVILHRHVKTHDTYTGTLLSDDEASITLQINLKGRITRVTLDKTNIKQINQAIKF